MTHPAPRQAARLLVALLLALFAASCDDDPDAPIDQDLLDDALDTHTDSSPDADADDANDPDADADDADADDGDDTDDADDADTELPPTQTTTTVLVYMISDNNLEKDGVSDIEELMSVPAGSHLDVLVQMDRAEAFYELGVAEIGNFTATKRLRVSEGVVEELEDLGEVDMSQPTALSEFITWGIETSPADRYVLIMWDHGMGWQGFGSDTASGDAFLDIARMSTAMRSALDAASVPEFAMIGFDACLMADLAIARHLRDLELTRYVVASEDFEPAHGWDYAAFSSLASDAELDMVTLGTAIIDAFEQQAEAERKDQSITLSLLDLDQLAAFDASLDALIARLEGNLAAWVTALASARFEAQSFGRSSVPEHSFQMVDLGDLAVRIAEQIPDVSAEATAVTDALDQLVLHEVHGPLTRDATGLAVFFPETSALQRPTFDAVAVLASWRSLLAGLYGEAGQLEVPHFSLGVCTMCLVTDPLDFSADSSCTADGEVTTSAQVEPLSSGLVARAWALLGYLDDDDRPLVLRRLPVELAQIGDQASADWDQRVLVVRQGQHVAPLFAESVVDGGVVYHEVPLVYSEPAACPCAIEGSPGYADTDGDGLANCIDPDDDDDGVTDDAPDVCPFVPDPDQLDADGDGTGDACQSDANAPALLCTPDPAQPFGRRFPLSLFVVTDVHSGSTLSTSFYVHTAGGVGEWRPRPGSVLHPMVLVPDEASGQWVWVEGPPLPVQADEALSFAYLALDEVLSADAGRFFVELHVENADGRGDEIHWLGTRDEVDNGAGCPVQPLTSCAGGQIPDCAGTCVDAGALTDQVCDDGSTTGVDLYCETWGYDLRGGCTPPACPQPHLVRDCDGDCLAPVSSLGDGFCHDGTASTVDLSCAVHGRDAGDCAPPTSCGDALCDAGTESCQSCADDCGACPDPCGNGACQPGLGEDCASCPADCGACTCGNGQCEVPAEDCAGCAQDCGACPACGDEVCSAPLASAPYDPTQAEDCRGCDIDCGDCQGPCCSAHPGVGGCSDATITSCVCDTDPMCCVSWTQDCVDLALGSCAMTGCCEPSCAGRTCGPDGCGGLCGTCAGGAVCDLSQGQCEVSCGGGQFACADQSACLDSTMLCDGTADCANGADEQSCGGCLPLQFDCGLAGGGCIELDDRCNGNFHCIDGSDEIGCLACVFSSRDVCFDQSGCYVFGAHQCSATTECADNSDEAACSGEFACSDGLDDDGDGYLDCDDPDCRQTAACGQPEVCDNGVDDDGDTLIDCDDANCHTQFLCREDCTNTVDDDGDGMIDCDDPECGINTSCTVELSCDDLIDNDGNKLVDCDDLDCAAVPQCIEPALRVFLSSEGPLPGSSADADAICQAEAMAAALGGAGWRAWVADLLVSPRMRFETLNTGPYLDLAGTTIVDHWQHLASGSLQAPIVVGATGATVSSTSNVVLTNTNAGGTQHALTCFGNEAINGTFGTVGATDTTWAGGTTLSCDAVTVGHVVCFEQR